MTGNTEREAKNWSIHEKVLKAMACITGNSEWPFFWNPDEYDLRCSPSLLGPIIDGVVYDARDSPLPRFKRVEEPIEPFEDGYLWKEIRHPGRREEADYFLFCNSDLEHWGHRRYITVEETNVCMLRTPLDDYWLLFAASGPRLTQAVRMGVADRYAKESKAALARQDSRSIVRHGLVAVAIAIAVALISQALSS